MLIRRVAHPTHVALKYVRCTERLPRGISSCWTYNLFLQHKLVNVSRQSPFYRTIKTSFSEFLVVFDAQQFSSLSSLSDIGHKLVLIAYRKLHMGFQLVPKSVSLNDLEMHFALYDRATLMRYLCRR